MKRVSIVALLTFLTASLWQTLALAIPYGLNILCLAPIVIAFSLQFFKPLETIWVCLVAGAIIDALGGFSIGVNMALMLAFSFVLGATNLFLGKLSVRELCLYVAGLSVLYRIAFFLAGIILVGQKINMSLGQIILGPVLDMLVAYIFYFILIRILRNDFANYGIGF